jgi:hypothetical protein
MTTDVQHAAQRLNVTHAPERRTGARRNSVTGRTPGNRRGDRIVRGVAMHRLDVVIPPIVAVPDRIKDAGSLRRTSSEGLPHAWSGSVGGVAALSDRAAVLWSSRRAWHFGLVT